jgi:hypothetical protein
MHKPSAMKTSRHRPHPRLHLSPLRGGAFTRWRLCGSFATAASLRDLRWLFGKLALWSGSPIELVLPAEAGTATWTDFWETVVERTPAHHLEVSFELPKHPVYPWMRPQKTVTRG